MNVMTTSGVRISVKTTYLTKNSSPLYRVFFYAYDITIKNLNNFPIQLLTRNWMVYDELNAPRNYEGEGVLGKQPMLNPGDSHVYRSFVDTRSIEASMEGHYTMINMSDKQTFDVSIPRLELNVPYKLN